MVSLLHQLRLHLIIVTLLSIVILLLNTSQIQTSSIIKSLYVHQHLVEQLTTLEQGDFGSTLIKLEMLRNKLQFNIDDINRKRSLDIVAPYFHDPASETMGMTALQKHTMNYHAAIQTHATIQQETKAYRQALQTERAALNKALSTLLELQSTLLFQKEAINSYVIYVTVFYIILIAIGYLGKLNAAVRDFNAINRHTPDYSYHVKELEYVSKDLHRSDESKRNEAYRDPLSQLHSLKGLIHLFNNKKIAYNYTVYVYVFSIDNYKEIRSHLSEETSQAIIKKIAFALSLYEKTNEHVARIGYDEFALVLPSDNQDAAYQACEQLRKTIEETRFKTKRINVQHLTISGVFIVKPKHKTLESAIEYGRHFLKTSPKRQSNSNHVILSF
ncbi:MAG: hypothetical protein DSZ03_02755 [Sulfurimonas sp.]|nr:MAG: hypothetical protein DSZ03_02755 [Sulfurimonas sp.]